MRLQYPKGLTSVGVEIPQVYKKTNYDSAATITLYLEREMGK